MSYRLTIGLEVHCELKTNAKVFSRGKNGYSDIPNSLVNKVDMAFPGIMPYPNKAAVRQAIKTATCLNCNIADELIFDRKNYYYVDLPKGWQITQVTKPLGKGGYLDIRVNDEVKRVEIEQLHLEEDTASLDHYDGYSLVDYNRSGIPLMETVTKPCMHSADEAVKFLEELRRIFLYCDISEADSKKGQMRCDVNVSLQREGQVELGTKVEMKNINSFSGVRAAIEYEIKRQGKLLDEGKDSEIIQETRRFDDNTCKTYSMRTKVDAVDYKYFIEPNIVPTKIDESCKEKIKSEIPMLSFEREAIYIEEHAITPYDAVILVKDREIADYFEECLNGEVEGQKLANWMNTRILSYINKYEKTIGEINIKPNELVELVKAIDKGDISSKQGKDMVYASLIDGKNLTELLNDDSNKQITDENEIGKLVDEIIEENIDQVESYNPEHSRLPEFFVGQVMKKSKGKANPGVARKVIMNKLNESVGD